MSLIEQIKTDQIVARKSKSDAVSLLTTLYSEALMVGKNATPPRDPTDAEVINTIKKFLKGVNENISYAGDRQDADWRDALEIEREILEYYLPKQLSVEELTSVITKFILNGGIATSNGTGLIMQYLKNTHGGMYDGKVASDIIKGLLKQ
jgi:uncharacterized protein YqeY